MFANILLFWPSASGPPPTPLVLDQPLYSVLLSPDNDPFGIDPDQTAVILTDDDDPFGIDPEQTVEL